MSDHSPQLGPTPPSADSRALVGQSSSSEGVRFSSSDVAGDKLRGVDVVIVVGCVAFAVGCRRRNCVV